MSSSEAQSLPPLVVHVIFSLGTGGLENGLVNIINRAPPHRYRHAIVCLTESGPFAKRLERPDVCIYELHKKPGNDLGMFWRLFLLLRKLQPAIVHTRNLAALETQVLGLFLPGVRRVHGEHGREITDLDGSNVRYRRLRRVLAPLIHRFICVSADLARWLGDDVRISRKKIVQIYNGVDHERFDSVPHSPDILPPGWLPEKDALILGLVGRLAAVKDQATLLCAVEHIVEQRPQLRDRLRVIVVGDGPLRSELERQARPIRELTWFAGDRADVPRLLAQFHVFVLPSLGEGVSNTILEAMSCGLPVVASDVGGNPELVEDGNTGLLFPVGNSRALADCLLRLIDNPERARQMGHAGKRRVRERHDWSSTVDAYLAVYDGLLRKNNHDQPRDMSASGSTD